MLNEEEIENIKKRLIEELNKTITANECGLSTNDFSESIKNLEGALRYIEQLEQEKTMLNKEEREEMSIEEALCTCIKQSDFDNKDKEILQIYRIFLESISNLHDKRQEKLKKLVDKYIIEYYKINNMQTNSVNASLLQELKCIIEDLESITEGEEE